MIDGIAVHPASISSGDPPSVRALLRSLYATPLIRTLNTAYSVVVSADAGLQEPPLVNESPSPALTRRLPTR